VLLLNGELNSSVVLEMDNCFGGLTSPFPAVITMAGTFLWICKKRSLFKVTSGFGLVSSGKRERHKNQVIGGETQASEMVIQVENRARNGYVYAVKDERKAQ